MSTLVVLPVLLMAALAGVVVLIDRRLVRELDALEGGAVRLAQLHDTVERLRAATTTTRSSHRRLMSQAETKMPAAPR